MTAPVVVHEDQGLQIATWSRVFINRWKVAATVQRLETLLEHELALIEAIEDHRIVVMTTLQDRSGGMPDGAAREKAEQIAQLTRDAQILHAQVVEGDGFVSATFRALLTGVNLAIRAPFPSRVFKSEAEALPWIEQGLAEAGYEQDAAGVAVAVARLRRG